MRSKKESILTLFYNHPTKQWHFEDVVREAELARSKAAGWLKRLAEEGLIRRIKEQGRMPYYLSSFESASYRYKKKLFALNLLYESGFLTHLDSLSGAKTIILFGSFCRSDWHLQSDIDVFIYGNAQGLDVSLFESLLGRNIQVFVCKDKNDLQKMSNGFLSNIVRGNVLKGNLDFLEVHAIG